MSTFNDVNSGKNLEPKDIANIVLYAVTQLDYVGVNEILVQPRDMPFQKDSRDLNLLKIQHY